MTVEIDNANNVATFIGDTIEGAVEATLFRVEGRLKRLTPVDTGFARNSWLLTNDRDDEGTPGSNDSSGYQYNLGTVAYINNGARYIGRLDQGHSQQAPNGMTSIVLPEIPMILTEEVAKRN